MEYAPGISHAAFAVTRGPPFFGHVFRIRLPLVDVRLLSAGEPGSRRSVHDIVSNRPRVVAVNASFFDEHDRPMGRAVDMGQIASAERRAAWGALVVEQGRARIVRGDALPPDIAGGDVVVQGVPRLVSGGVVPGLKDQSSVRTAVCAAGEEILVVTSSDVPAEAFARFLANPPERGGLGCTDALNLDGGPSTQVVARLPGLEIDEAGGWGVPNALAFIPRADVPTPAAVAH